MPEPAPPHATGDGVLETARARAAGRAAAEEVRDALRALRAVD